MKRGTVDEVYALGHGHPLSQRLVGRVRGWLEQGLRSGFGVGRIFGLILLFRWWNFVLGQGFLGCGDLFWFGGVFHGLAEREHGIGSRHGDSGMSWKYTLQDGDFVC